MRWLQSHAGDNGFNKSCITVFIVLPFPPFLPLESLELTVITGGGVSLSSAQGLWSGLTHRPHQQGTTVRELGGCYVTHLIPGQGKSPGCVPAPDPASGHGC